MHDATESEITKPAEAVPHVKPEVPKPTINVKYGKMTDLRPGAIVVLSWSEAGTSNLMLSPAIFRIQRIDPSGKVILKAAKRS
jgi:hypothetical protein